MLHGSCTPQALVWGPGPTAEKEAALHGDPALLADMAFVSLGPSDIGSRRLGPDLLALAADAPPADLTDPALRAAMSATASISPSPAAIDRRPEGGGALAARARLLS